MPKGIQGRRDDFLLADSWRALRSRWRFSQGWRDGKEKGIPGYYLVQI